MRKRAHMLCRSIHRVLLVGIPEYPNPTRAENDMLSAIMDGKLVVWYYPNVVFVDRDLVNKTKFVKESSDFGKDPQILHFHGTNVTIRRSDGAQLVAAVSPYPTALYGIVQRNMWEQAIQLCRYVKDSTLWACLAVMALADKELSTTEVAFAAIDEVAKLQFVSPPRTPLKNESLPPTAWCQRLRLIFSLFQGFGFRN
jgi:intraflagellar transport protein 80